MIVEFVYPRFKAYEVLVYESLENIFKDFWIVHAFVFVGFLIFQFIFLIFLDENLQYVRIQDMIRTDMAQINFIQKLLPIFKIIL